jgi:CubicO group peptidase (beta-lactamase class C family)
MRHSLLGLMPVLAAQLVIAQPQTPPPDLTTYVNRVLQTFEVPGLALAIVHDGHVVLAEGYGVRKLGESTPVDSRTLFGIASNTKAFTATALAILEEQGKLEWDAPVTAYLPWFQLSDPYVTRALTVRDLLVHRSGLGLGAGDLLWWPASTYNRKEIVQRLRFIPLATGFRSSYAYDNVLYLVAGELIEALSGKSWEDFVQENLLNRVGMTGSNVLHSGAGTGGDVATTHARVHGRVQPVKPFLSDNTNPAGGINTNAEDIAKWMIVQLDSGRLAGGGRLFSPKTTRELWTLVTPIRPPIVSPQMSPLRSNFFGYALGFWVRDYRCKKLVYHSGSLPGYLSRVTLVPELKLGVAVLTNQESGAAYDALTYHILDYYLQAAPHDWLGAYKRMEEREDSAFSAAERSAALLRTTTSSPPLPLERFAGTYTDKWYGDIAIAPASGKLRITFSHTPSLTGTLEYWQYNTFLARWDDPELRADAFVTFTLNPDGSIDTVKMKAASPATDFSFDFQDLLFKPSMPGRAQ